MTTPPDIRFHHGRFQRAEAQGLIASASKAIRLNRSLAFGLAGEPGYCPAAAWASTRPRFYHLAFSTSMPYSRRTASRAGGQHDASPTRSGSRVGARESGRCGPRG